MWGVEGNALHKCVFRSTRHHQVHGRLIGATGAPINLPPPSGAAGPRQWHREFEACEKKKQIGPRNEARFACQKLG